MYIGIDLGGTNIDAGLVSEEGVITLRKSIPTRAERGSAEVIKDIIRLIKMLSESNSVQSIGVGVPGTVIREKGIVNFACNINFHNVHLVHELNQQFDFPVYLDNDANCAALGEAVCGAAENFDTSLMVTIGTGIGGGFVINNRIYRGFNGAAGEIGHMVIETKGLDCACGRKGCFEKYASSSALVEEAKRKFKNQGDTILQDMTSGNIDKLNGEMIFSAAKQGDHFSLSLIDRYTFYLSEGLANLISIFEPEIMVIGGAICRQWEYLLTPLREKVYNNIYSRTLPKTKIKASVLGSDSGIIGASQLWRG